MSLAALVWAIYEADVTDPLDKLVLVVLAEHFNDETRAAWPTVTRIAQTVPCSRRTVQTHLQQLEDQGVIERGDQAAVGHLPANRRPTVYTLPVQVELRPRQLLRGAAAAPQDASRGAAGRHSGVQLAAHRTKNRTSKTLRARGETDDGAVVGCAAHAPRRSPACSDCQRVLPPTRAEIRPAVAGPAKAREALREATG